MKRNSSSKSPTIDPEQFNDAVALLTKWNSTFGTSASFTTHILVEKNIKVFEYQPTIQNIAFCFGYMLFAGFALFMTIFAAHSMFGAVICGLFLVVGILLVRDSSVPITFDKEQGVFYKGWRLKERTNKKKFARLEDIHAVQLLENRAGAELNLVLKDGSRIFVLTNRSKRQMSIDGELISKFLGIPVWDAISKPNES